MLRSSCFWESKTQGREDQVHRDMDLSSIRSLHHDISEGAHRGVCISDTVCG